MPPRRRAPSEDLSDSYDGQSDEEAEADELSGDEIPGEISSANCRVMSTRVCDPWSLNQQPNIRFVDWKIDHVLVCDLNNVWICFACHQELFQQMTKSVTITVTLQISCIHYHLINRRDLISHLYPSHL